MKPTARLRTRGFLLQSEWRGSAIASTQVASAATPAVIPTLTAFDAGPGVIELDWTASPSAASYTIYRSSDGGQTYAAIATGVTATSYLDTTTTDGVSYSYTITATDGKGVEGSQSSAQTAVSGGAWVPLDGSVQPDIFSPTVSDFSSGASLPAGTYRVDYLGGTMTYQVGVQGYYVNTFFEGDSGFEISQSDQTNDADTHGPTTTTTPVIFQHATPGAIGMYLRDNPYYDNGPGPEGTPRYELERLAPQVSVVATQPDALEAGLVPAIFSVTRTGDTFTSLDVSYVLSGAAVDDGGIIDTGGGLVHIPAGANSAQIVIAPVNDSGEGPDEAINVQLVASAGTPATYADPATNPASQPATAAGQKKDAKITLQGNNPLQGTPPTDAEKASIDTTLSKLSDDDPAVRAQAASDLKQQLLKNPALIDYANTQAGGNDVPPQENTTEIAIAKAVTLQLEPFIVGINAGPEHTRLHIGLQPPPSGVDFIRMFVYSADESIVKAGPNNEAFEIDQIPSNATNIDDGLADLIGLKPGTTKLIIKEQFYAKNPNDPQSPMLVAPDRNFSLDITVN